MIIRKPYAFLIKNFRKIHIALLLLGSYVFYKTIRVALFVSEFMNYGVYDPYANPISKHITLLMRLSVLLMLIGSVAILFLLKHKNKPWQSYAFPAILYLLLFLVLGMIRSFFNTYTEVVDTTNLRLSADLLLIFMFSELPALAIFGMRILGIDIKAFNFKSDLDQLELSDEDREEIELSLKVDLYSFVRLGRKLLRYLGYFYQEHKIICRTLIVVLLFLFVKGTYQAIFVNNKSYKAGEVYNINNYTIKVTNSYFTNRDDTGKIISNDSNFVIVEFEVENKGEEGNLNTSNFHLRAGTKDYKTTENTYSKEFSDLGTTYKKVRKIQKDEKSKFIIVYKVNKRIRKSKFVLYYQEKSGIFKLRKLKLKTKDINKQNKEQTLEAGDFFDIKMKDIEDSLAFDEYELTNIVDYKVNKCTTEGCNVFHQTYTSPDGYKVIVLEFSSDYFEAKNMIDFLTRYGKIKYKDNEDKIETVPIEMAIDKNYFGKYIYLNVSNEIAASKEITLEITTRNNTYLYKIV